MTTDRKSHNYEVEDVLLYNSKLVLRNEKTGDEEFSDVYDGALKTFTKLDSYAEVSRKGDENIDQFVVELPSGLTKKAILTLIRYIHQGLSKGNPRECKS